MGSFSFDHLDASDWAGEMAWLRSLAASLVRDPDEAADLAGDVWVQALERRPVVGESRSLRAWLTVVTRRLAARKRREGDARHERERRSARPEAVPPADKSIERVELQRKLVEAVLALDEPYRSAVVLRHLEQLDSAEIARRQGCTNELARQRVSRGLQQLRARLDRDFGGGRETWRALFVPFAAHAPLASGVALGGASLVSSKVVGGMVACAAAALLWWWLPLDFLARSSPDPREVAAADALESPTVNSALQTPAMGAARDHAQPAFHRPRLAGQIVDAAGAPLEGVRVSFTCGHESDALDGQSDASGRFEVWLDAALQAATFDALARGPEFGDSTAVLRPGEDALIVMRRLPRVEVSVLGPDGRAPEGSGCVKLLVLDKSGGTRTTSLELEEDGVARSDPLEPGRLVRVYAAFDGFALFDSMRADELTGDATLHIDVALSRGVTMRGRVLDERTRRPVASALVRAVPNDGNNLLASPSATTDASGRFELRGVSATRRSWMRSGPSDSYDVTVDAKGFAFPPERRLVWQHAVGATPPALLEDLELALIPAGCSLSVTLRWPNGSPGGTLSSVCAFDLEGDVFLGEPGAAGECNFHELPAGELRVIAQHPEGVASAQLALLQGEKRTLALTLRKADAAVEVSVRDAGGRAVPGAQVRIKNFVDQSGKRTFLESWSYSVDEQGRFRFDNLYPSACEVSVENADTDPTAYGFWPPLVRLDLDEGALAVVDFVAEPPVAYAGKLEPTTAIGTAGPVLLQLTHATYGVVSSLFVHEDGRFSFPRIFGADYVLIAKQGEVELGRLAVSRAGSSELVVPIAR